MQIQPYSMWVCLRRICFVDFFVLIFGFVFVFKKNDVSSHCSSEAWSILYRQCKWRMLWLTVTKLMKLLLQRFSLQRINRSFVISYGPILIASKKLFNFLLKKCDINSSISFTLTKHFPTISRLRKCLFVLKVGLNCAKYMINVCASMSLWVLNTLTWL